MEAEKKAPETIPQAIERDRSDLASAIKHLDKVTASHSWLALGRGSYGWDDDRYQKEFGRALDHIEDAIKPLRRIASDWTHCPKTGAEAREARIRSEEQPWIPIRYAPRDGTPIWCFTAASDGLPSFESECAWHPDAGFCTDEIRVVTHWKPINPAIDVEQTLREELWLNHGHSLSAIYGDDSEMQCVACAPFWDYKRMPIDVLVNHVKDLRLVITMKSLEAQEREKHFNELMKQLADLSLLKPNWDSYGAGVPSVAATVRARACLLVLEVSTLYPDKVLPSADGGVGINFIGSRNRRAFFEFLNEGHDHLVLYEYSHMTSSETILWDDNNLFKTQQTLSRLKEWLDGGEQV